MTTLSDLVAERKKLSREDFIAAWPTAVLLHRVEDEDDEERAFKTGITDPRGSRLELVAGLTTQPDLAVMRIEKRPGSPFKDRISVGRSRNSDIQIEYPKISKFHAYFTWTPDEGQFHITDAGSTNGTFVNSHRLDSGTAVILPDRALLSFGRYHFRFHTAAGLYDVLSEIAYGAP